MSVDLILDQLFNITFYNIVDCFSVLSFRVASKLYYTEFNTKYAYIIAIFNYNKWIKSVVDQCIMHFHVYITPLCINLQYVILSPASIKLETVHNLRRAIDLDTYSMCTLCNLNVVTVALYFPIEDKMRYLYFGCHSCLQRVCSRHSHLFYNRPVITVYDIEHLRANNSLIWRDSGDYYGINIYFFVNIVSRLLLFSYR